jgi:hypothetical protein
LTSTIDGIKKSYDLDATKYITNMWDADKTYAQFNVSVPLTTSDTDPDNCVFINDLNSPFVTWTKDQNEDAVGVIALDKSVTKIQFFFCADDIKKITKIGDIAVKFSVSGDVLSATVDGVTEEIATIDNSGSVKTTSDLALPNAITYNKESEIAKKLLNTNQMYTYIGAKGYVCGSTDREVAITFKGANHYKADFIRPVNIAAKAADNFIDGVDFGEKGSYIRLEDLVAPYDWRDRQFSKYANYWQFYGAFSIEADTESAMCDLNAEGVTAKTITLATGSTVKAIAVPVTVELKSTTDTSMGTSTSEYGFITYKNNGTRVNDAFNIYVKVKVSYGWGEIYTDYITVPVAPTIVGNK